jgi:fatty acid desaturase
MMPQNETNEAVQGPAEPIYGGYEGNQTTSQRYEMSYKQASNEEVAGKVYPQPHDNKNVLRFALAVIAMIMLLLFGLLFVAFIGGVTGWVSFAVASFAIFIIAVVGIQNIH